MRELIEQGFEVAVVKDATAAARIKEGDCYAAALVNFIYIANKVWTTKESRRLLHQALLSQKGVMTNEKTNQAPVQ